MEWSNLNEQFSSYLRQMIEQFFQNSNSPTSNADVSLNFTRTSRQSGSNTKPNRQVSPKIYQKTDNPESDFMSFADKQIQKFDQWFNSINSQQQKPCRQKNQFSQSTAQEYFQELFRPQNLSKSLKKSQSLENNILQKMQILSTKLSQPVSKYCSSCQAYENKLSELQMYTKSIEIQLKAKNQELKCVNMIQINQLGQQMAYQVENKLFQLQINDLKCKNAEFLEIIQLKNKEVIKLNEEIEKFNLERSTFYFKNRTLENKVLEMQKSKSLMLSATKNSTTHSDFNITNCNNNNSTMFRSQQQSNIDSTLIHTNQFSTQKSSPEEYIQWFQKLKQIFLEKYKRQEKQFLLKYHPQVKNNENSLKQIVNNFKKGHARYEIARSCKNIADYIKKNKQNFIELIGNQTLSGLKMGMESSCGKLNMRSVEEIQQELRKTQKIAKGLQSQISHLNSQLSTLKKTLVKQKQEKSHLLRTCNQLKQQLEQIQGQLQFTRQQIHKHEQKMNGSNIFTSSINELKQEICHLQQELAFKADQLSFKSDELKKSVYKCKRQQEVQQKLQLAVKQTQYLLYKQRKDKIKYFKEPVSLQTLTTACRIRPKSINQKSHPSIIHEYDGRVYVDKEKLSYKFDLIQQVNKKAQSQIILNAKKVLLNCIYEPKNSLLLSMGSSDSEFREFMRNQKGFMWTCLNQIFKLRQSEKRFLQINLTLNCIGMSNSQVFDALDKQNPNKKILIKRQGSKISLLNSIAVPIQTQQEAKSVLREVFLNQTSNQTNLITIIELSILDKRNKQKYTSKLMFGEVGLYNAPKEQTQDIENLVKDSRAIEIVFNCMNFKQSYQPELNRLTHLLSECLNENSKNLLIMNVSPTQLHKQNSMASLSYGAKLKSLETKTSNSFLRYSQKTPEHSTSKLVPNQSQSLIKTPTLNPDFNEQKPRNIMKHRNSSSQHPTSGGEILEKKKRTISRLSIC